MAAHAVDTRSNSFRPNRLIVEVAQIIPSICIAAMMIDDIFGSMVVPVSRNIMAANDVTVIVPEN